jgi:hypothetical protein
VFESRTALLAKRTQLRGELQRKLSRKNTRELIVGKANTADSIKKRLAYVESCFTSVL